jgi:microtubule-associated protein-like 6
MRIDLTGGQNIAGNTKQIEDWKVQARCVDINLDKQLFAAGMKDGTLRLYKTDGSLSFEKKVTKKNIACVQFSPDGSKVAFGAHDAKLYMIDLENNNKMSSVKRSSSAVLHIDFSEDGNYIRTSDQAYEYLFYTVSDLKQDPSGATNCRDMAWMSQHCTLGWGVQGIWHPSQDGSDINAAQFTRNPVLGLGYQLLATANDDGNIHVFRYPCCNEESDKVIARGHSSHPTNVQWSADGTRLFSLGGNDTALIKWKVEKK